MGIILENIVGYGIVLIILFAVIIFYLRRTSKLSQATDRKIFNAIESGFYEPVSLHPVISSEICIGSGACIQACPEKDILGWKDGKATVINASQCVGHGACFHACPVQAITLCIGSEKRGVELPHVNQQFETNVPMLFIAGEIGGMGLIKNAVEQGKQAVDYIKRKLPRDHKAGFDLIIVGAGPAGISASLNAKKHNLKFLTIEQDSLGGTVFSFPRDKIVMTSPMELPLEGKVKLTETSKVKLLELWNSVLSKNNISISQQEKVNLIEKKDTVFLVKTSKGEYTSPSVLLAIGRRGSPRKLGVAGEEKGKVHYRLLEPELIINKNILIVGGGDSAVESALLLADSNNNVTLSYRSESFARIKPKNLERINKAINSEKVNMIFNSNVKKIDDLFVEIELKDKNEIVKIENDLVYIFAGGELPTKFLQNAGVRITKKFGEVILSHKKKIE